MALYRGLKMSNDLWEILVSTGILLFMYLVYVIGNETRD